MKIIELKKEITKETKELLKSGGVNWYYSNEIELMETQGDIFKGHEINNDYISLFFYRV